MAEKKYLVVVLRGHRGEGHYGSIVARDVPESDLASVEAAWNTAHAPCETYALLESDDKTTLDADHHQAVAPVAVDDDAEKGES